jgi:2-polyprenyl-6-methoxyphenol hydroxylase-like FAD-dependent oxidoreductase
MLARRLHITNVARRRGNTLSSNGAFACLFATDVSPYTFHVLPALASFPQRHDGTEVAVADETVLAGADEENQDFDLQPIGIRRWRLQRILYEAALEEGITIHFGKRLESITAEETPTSAPSSSSSSTIRMRFVDGSTCTTGLLLAADGAKSAVRSIVTEGRDGKPSQLTYTGTTCLMGTSSTARTDRGLTLPSSPTTKCHGAFYPTGPDEQCFQFHFPTPSGVAQPSSTGSWGGMTHHVSQEECRALADQLETEGWDEKYLAPLRNVDKALRIGLTTLVPALETFTYGRVVLVGDAAHPPVPYLGQGAQQGMEDAGTLALLLTEMGCVTDEGGLTLCRVDEALKVYDSLRVPRTTEIVERGKLVGKQQQKRAENPRYNVVREELIQRDVFYNENSSAILPAVRHDYREAVRLALEANSQHQLLPVAEDDESAQQ